MAWEVSSSLLVMRGRPRVCSSRGSIGVVAGGWGAATSPEILAARPCASRLGSPPRTGLCPARGAHMRPHRRPPLRRPPLLVTLCARTVPVR